MNFASISDGVVEGVVAALAIGVLALSRDIFRSFALRSSIKKSARRLSFGTSLDGATIGIRNRTGQPLTVRRIAIQSADGHFFVLKPTGEVHSISNAETKLSRADKKRLYAGEVVRQMSEFAYGMEKLTPPQGFPVIEPYTSQTFLLAAELTCGIEESLIDIEIVFEFVDHLKHRKLLKVSVKDDLDILNWNVAEIKKEIAEGSLDQLRARSRKPPVKRIFAKPRFERATNEMPQVDERGMLTAIPPCATPAQAQAAAFQPVPPSPGSSERA